MRSGWLRSLPWLLPVGLAVLLALPAVHAQPTAKKTEKGPATKKEAKELTVTDNLTPDLPTDKARAGCYYRIHPFRMEAGKTYTIDLMSGHFDAWLRVVDASGKALVEDDDSGGGQNARVVFTAPRTETYQLVATTFGAGQQGQYTLTVRPGRLAPRTPSPRPVAVMAYGDLQLSLEGPPSQTPPHGYVEYRLTVTNSSDEAHQVKVAFPKDSNPLGIHLRALTRTVDVGPSATVSVSLLQPDLPMQGGGQAEVFIDGQPQRTRLPFIALGNRGQRVNYFGGSYNYQPAILCLQDVSTGFLQANWHKAGLPPLLSAPVPLHVPPGGGLPGRIRTMFSGNFQFNQLPLDACGTHWLGYSGYDGIVATAGALAQAKPEVTLALCLYVECGGSLVVVGPWDVPKAWEGTRQVEDGVARHYPGFGQCLVVDEPNIDKWQQPQWHPVVESWYHTAAPWLGLRTPTQANIEFPAVENLTVPVREMFVLMLIFAIVIGPVNLFILTRKKRRIWMLWTVPAISLVTCLTVLGYMLVSEGWEGHARAEGITVLDETSHRAATLGWVAFYTPLTPSDGLHFSFQTELTAQLARDTFRMTNRPRTIDWTGDQQHLDSGWLTARVPADFALRKTEEGRRERVGVRKDKDGTLTMLNGLGADVRSIRLMGKKGKVYAADHVPAGKEIALKANGEAVAPAKTDALRELYRDSNWPLQVHRVARRPETLLRPGRYVAVLEATPFIEDGLSRPGYRRGLSVVYGIMKDPIEE